MKSDLEAAALSRSIEASLKDVAIGKSAPHSFSVLPVKSTRGELRTQKRDSHSITIELYLIWLLHVVVFTTRWRTL